MPIGNYPDWDACIADQKKKGHSDESSKKICGYLENQSTKGAAFTGLGDLVNTSVAPCGALYLKYFLADESLNVNGWALDLSPDKIQDAIGKPFPKQIKNEDSLYGDGHLWSRKSNATYMDHLLEANDPNNKQGEIVDISKSSEQALKSASGVDILRNNGYFATVKITDPEYNKIYHNNPHLIPNAVSIGICDLDRNPASPVVKNYNVVHLMPVERGAYGPKATLYATCNGTDQQCVTELKGAARKAYNPEYSSLGILEAKNNLVMPVDTTQESTKVQSTTDNANISTTAPVVTDQNKAVTKTTGSPIIRLKTQQKQTAPTNQEGVNTNTNTTSTQQLQNQPVQQEEQPQKDITQTPEFQKLQEEVNELKAQRELAIKKEKIARIIPMQLFIDQKGRFNHEDFGRAVETALNENWSEESIKTFYDMKLDHLNLLNSINNGSQYVPISEQTAQLQQPEVPTMGMKGASVSANNGYQTNSEVPELKGASNVNSLGISALKGLRNMIAVSGDNA